jgi:RimJ/RimL family protein N-acetyltransferase
VSSIVLETRRLILRRLTLEDVEDLARIYADPDVTRFLGGPRTLQQTREWVEGNILWYDRLEHDMLATVLKENGRLIDPENVASQRVAEKNGMRYEKDGEHEGQIFRVYAVQMPARAERTQER